MVAGIANLTVTLPLETVVVQLQTQPKGAAERRSAGQLAAELWRTGLWKSYWISCALTLNPALTTAIFDALKARYLAVLASAGRHQRSLNTAQSFALGSLSKASYLLWLYLLWLYLLLRAWFQKLTALSSSVHSRTTSRTGRAWVRVRVRVRIRIRVRVRVRVRG